MRKATTSNVNSLSYTGRDALLSVSMASLPGDPEVMHNLKALATAKIINLP